MTRLQLAETTLDGQVNDWVARAKQLASVVIDLHREAAGREAAHLASVETLQARVVQLEQQRDVTHASAEVAAAGLGESAGRIVELETAVVAYEMSARNLLARIVEKPDNAFVFMAGSRGAIQTLRKLIGA